MLEIVVIRLLAGFCLPVSTRFMTLSFTCLLKEVIAQLATLSPRLTIGRSRHAGTLLRAARAQGAVQNHGFKGYDLGAFFLKLWLGTLNRCLISKLPNHERCTRIPYRFWPKGTPSTIPVAHPI